MTHKALVVNNFWATIFSGIAVIAVTGGVVYLLTAKAEASRALEGVKTIEEARLPERLARLEAEMIREAEATRRIETKLDKIIDVMVKR